MRPSAPPAILAARVTPACPEPVTGMRFTLLLVLATALLFAVFPELDLRASGLFWDPARGFFLRDAPWARLLYEWVPLLAGCAALAGILALLHNLVRRRSLGPFTSRRVLYILVALALGPGLVVNVVFKDHWGRARPRDVEEFGGDRRFTPAFVIADQCESNCSFVAGHPSVGFVLAGVAFVDRRRRKAWLACGIALGVVIGFGRIVQGAHFLSDVVFSGVFVLATCSLLARYVFRFPSGPGENGAPDTHGTPEPGSRAAARLGVLLGLLCSLAGTTPAPAQEVGDAPAGDGAIRLLAVGDIMMGTTFPDSSYLNPDLAAGANIADVLDAELLALLRTGDIVFGNLEGALFDGEGETKDCRDPELCYAFRSPERYAGFLRDMGFNLVSLANNHSGDFLDPGREATIGALERNGIAYAGLDREGARTSVRQLRDGTLVGLVAFSPNKGTLSINDSARAVSIIADLAARADIVVVSFHGGAEGADRTHVPHGEELFHRERRGDVRAFARAAVDAGAHVVLGHGPHVPRAVEVYRDRFIAYSLGNFWTYARFNLRGPNGLAPLLELRLAADGTLLGARLHSARQSGLGGPRLDRAGGALRLVESLTREDFPDAALEFDRDGTIRWPGGAGGDAPSAPEDKQSRGETRGHEEAGD